LIIVLPVVLILPFVALRIFSTVLELDDLIRRRVRRVVSGVAKEGISANSGVWQEVIQHGSQRFYAIYTLQLPAKPSPPPTWRQFRHMDKSSITNDSMDFFDHGVISLLASP